MQEFGDLANCNIVTFGKFKKTFLVFVWSRLLSFQNHLSFKNTRGKFLRNSYSLFSLRIVIYILAQFLKILLSIKKIQETSFFFNTFKRKSPLYFTLQIFKHTKNVGKLIQWTPIFSPSRMYLLHFAVCILWHYASIHPPLLPSTSPSYILIISRWV